MYHINLGNQQYLPHYLFIIKLCLQPLRKCQNVSMKTGLILSDEQKKILPYMLELFFVGIENAKMLA